MRWLRAARDCGLAEWCLGAGVVRTLVWNHLHDLPPDSHAPADVDFVYFDAADLTAEREAAIAHRLRGAQTLPDFKFTCDYHITLQPFSTS